MLFIKKLRPLSLVWLILLLNVNQAVAADTGTMSDIDIGQTKKELTWQGITGIIITVTVEVEFTVQVAEATPTVFFEASIRKSGSSSQLSEAGHQSKVVTNNTKSTMEFEMVPITISSTGKAGTDSSISLKKGDKMILDVEMYYYASGEITKTTLDTKSKTFYLMASPPTSLLIFALFAGILLIIGLVVIWLYVRQRKQLD